MIYVITKTYYKNTPSYEVRHYEIVTQNIIDKYSPMDMDIRVNVNEVNSTLWVEVNTGIGNNSAIFYNDAIKKPKRNMNQNQEIDKETELFKRLIKDYKRELNLEQLLG